MKLFEVTDKATIVCRSENTRSGFRHLATLMIDGSEVDSAKCCYQNRTWEAYTFQSVIHSLLDKTTYLTEEEKALFKKREEKRQHEKISGEMKMLGGIMAMGDLLCDDKAEKNAWKLRMLKAKYGDALSIPEGWDTLKEDEKASRLKKIEALHAEA